MNDSASTSEPGWSVTVEERGRSGLIHYREGQNAALFYWEFGSGRAVVLICWPNDSNKWDELYPWAIGRKGEILEKVARDVCRQKTPNCSFEIVDSHITILEPAKP